MIRSFNGKTPEIADSAFVSEAAYVLGDVRIGDNSGVWRADVTICHGGSLEECVQASSAI